MIYNIHPIFVHFPIALLFIYSIIKILPMRKILPKVVWKDVERLFLIIGVLGAFLALATGETAEHLIRTNRQLVDIHSTFGTISTYIYGALLLGEIVTILNTYKDKLVLSWRWLLKISILLENMLCNKTFSLILAIAGIIAISLTGLLGGIITYGVTADPVAPLILKILGITL